jgi:sarcosine oxidase subunit alpha
VIPGAVVLGATGVLRVAGIVIASAAGAREAIACDVIAMSGGWTPSVHLFSQSRGTLAFDAASGAFLPAVSAQNERSIGACAGVFGLEAALIDGASAGDAAAPRPSVSGDLPAASGALVDGAATDAKAFVDFQNDVTARDLRLAAREGMRSIEHIKRYTTTGMATDQGKSSNINALAIAADALGKTIPEVGLTTFRAPYTPATFATFATMTRGPLYDPVRQTPLHSWARDNGAVFEEAGLWMRASRFPRAGESVAETIARECNGTRNAAGMMDASTLGKLEVVGPDAAEFLNRTYINSFDKLAVGRCRYGIMLSEQGMVMDDGVIARLAPGRFHVTTTSVGAAHVVAQWDDYAQTEWPELKVWYTSITEQWATIAINGPRARDMLLPLVEGVDISAAAMPHMAVREGRICGVPTRLFRVSFTGELGFEVNVPADYGRSVWEAIWAQGQAHGCVAYGLDTLLILRAEKGYIVVGQETDSTVTPDDLGYRAMIAKKKPDFVGKRSLAMADLSRPGRKQLVGLLPSDTALKLDEGAQIVETPTPATGSHAIGHVTSAYFSPTLGRGFALALIENGRARMGDMVHATTMTGTAPARIVETVFHDKEGKRLDG